MKLTPRSSVGHLTVTPLLGRYARRPTPMRPNRPHIPSYFQFSKSYRQTKNVRSANFLAYPFAPCLQIFRTSASSSVASVRHRRVSASVKRYLRRAPGTRKSKKHLCRKNFAKSGNLRKILWLAQESPQSIRRCDNFLAIAAWHDRSQAEARRPIPIFGTSRRARRPRPRPR